MRIVLPVVSALCLLYTPSGIAQSRPRPKPANPIKTETAPRQPQQAAPALPVLPDIRNDPDVKAADIAIIANITAEELRFDVVPNSTVEFPGKPQSKTIWQAERFNLPDKIEPGVTYRNIGIRLKITSTLADIDRIVAEALGEIPLSQDKTSPNDASAPASAKPSPKAPAQGPAAPSASPTRKVPSE
jgi:hypothetical protein